MSHASMIDNAILYSCVTAAVITTTLILSQTDVISRRILSPVRLRATRRRTQWYNIEQGIAKAILFIRRYVNEGGFYDWAEEKKIMDLILDDDEIQNIVHDIVQHDIVQHDSGSDNNNNNRKQQTTPIVVRISKDFTLPKADQWYINLAFPIPKHEQSQSHEHEHEQIEIEQEHYGRRIQVPLCKFGTHLYAAYQKQQQNQHQNEKQNLCFIADASSSLGTHTLAQIIEKSNWNMNISTTRTRTKASASTSTSISIIHEPTWMYTLAVLIQKKELSQDILDQILYSLCKLNVQALTTNGHGPAHGPHSRRNKAMIADDGDHDGNDSDHDSDSGDNGNDSRDRSSGRQNTIVITLPGQSCTATLLPALQRIFPCERHVFVYDGCVNSVERGMHLIKQSDRNHYHANNQDDDQKKNVNTTTTTNNNNNNNSTDHYLPVTSIPRCLSSTIPISPLNKLQNFTNLISKLQHHQASILEAWMSSVDTFLSLKEEAEKVTTANINRRSTTRNGGGMSNSSSSSSSSSRTNNQQMNPSITPQIQLTKGEQELFDLLAQVIKSNNISSTLRVAGGWVRDKLLATEEFHRDSTTSSSSISIGSMSSSASTSISSTGLVDRLTSKYNGPSLGRNGSKLIGLSKTSPSTTSSAMTLIDSKDLPVDIDVALDDMLGREFADHLNEWLTQHGQETISVGVVLKNPEKSKHLETATMKVGKFWIDFVNLRAEEYTEDSRIPDLMRIGTAHEDAYRRDLTINALFYNINTGQVEDFTGRGVDDLKKGVVATPLPPLTTLLDDPLRVLRSVRFAARLRFTMEESLKNAAMNERVRIALSQKVARERIGAEVDLMLRSQDPVGAIRLLINLNLAGTVFAIDGLQQQPSNTSSASDNDDFSNKVFQSGLNLLSTTHDHLVDCKVNTPIWCEKKRVTAAATNGVNEVVLMEDEECRRKLWYASFLKPLRDHFKVMRQEDKEKVGRRQGKKANRSMIMKVMVDELKRPVRDAEAVEAIMKGADDFTNLLNAGCDLSSIACLVAEIRIINSGFAGSKISNDRPTCLMGKKNINCETEDDPVWCGAMEYRLLVSKVLTRLGPLWRAALVLSLSEQLALIEHEDFSYTIEGDVYEEAQEEKRIGLVQTYDAFAASLLQLGLVGIWSQEPLIDGKVMKSKDILPNIPKGPVFREIMDEQENWMNMHPGGSKEGLVKYLREVFHEYI